MTNLPLTPAVTKREFIIGTVALAIGCISGVLYEQHRYERKLAEQIMNQVTSQQQRLQQSNDDFDKRFKESSDRFSQAFEAMKTNLQKED
jgi:predicted RNase H-like nuclease (RuvC/YqgF family)